MNKIAQSARAVARANKEKDSVMSIDKLYFITVVIVAAYSTAGWLLGC